MEGLRSIEQIIENGAVEVQTLFFDQSQVVWEQPYWQKQCGRFQTSTIGENNFAGVTDTDNPQGVIALCALPDEADIDFLAEQEGLILAFDAVQDPGNMGTMIRTAAWFGVSGLLAGKGTVDLFHPKVVRSSAGAVGAMPHRFVDLNEVLPKLEAEGRETILLESSPRSVNIRDADVGGRPVVTVGNEAHGINPKLHQPGRKSVHINAKGDDTPAVESLNAAISLSIALYEFS